jgi:hypothetical protein
MHVAGQMVGDDLYRGKVFILRDRRACGERRDEGDSDLRSRVSFHAVSSC